MFLAGGVPAVALEQQDRAGEPAPDPEDAPVDVIGHAHLLELLLREAAALLGSDDLLVDFLADVGQQNVDLDVLELLDEPAPVSGIDEQPVIQHEVPGRHVGHVSRLNQAHPAITALAISVVAVRPHFAGDERQIDVDEASELAIVDLTCALQVCSLRLEVVVVHRGVDDDERMRAKEQRIAIAAQVLATQVQHARLGIAEDAVLPVFAFGGVVAIPLERPHAVGNGEGVLVAILDEPVVVRVGPAPVGLAPHVQLEVVTGQAGHLLSAVTDDLDKPTAGLPSSLYVAKSRC
jgi:hypothetical protein